MTEDFLVIGNSWISIEDICDVALQHRKIRLNDDQSFINKIDKGARFVDQLLTNEGYVYGVTTGFGDSCTVSVPLYQVAELPKNLYTYHGCGMGNYFDCEQTRAILVTRLVSLAQGYSGVRYQLLNQITKLLELDILPLIPQEGSVGASGDLTPLSYVAAVIAGEREVMYQGRQVAAADVFSDLAVQPLALKPKEGLAIMNGTAVMTAIACLVHYRAQYLVQISARITSLACIALQGNADHFSERLFALKPHPGQIRVADWIRSDLQLKDNGSRNELRLQDRYSLRCAPHVIGVLEDSLPWFREFIERELNSSNDNPVIDPDLALVMHGGHFYGGHIAMTMDSMKTAVANLADLMDRQLAQLVDPKMNHGLPANLSGACAERAMLNHGFKAVQIAVSAWTAEALKLTMPASVFSRSTECHNQDKVSMGTIAARDCLRILELTEQVAAASLLAVVQGVELRQNISALPPALTRTVQEVRAESAFLEQDRALDCELKTMVQLIRKRHWSLYE